MSTANPATANTDNVTATDRAAAGRQPDFTPATGGTTTGGGGGGGVSSLTAGYGITVTPNPIIAAGVISATHATVYVPTRPYLRALATGIPAGTVITEGGYATEGDGGGGEWLVVRGDTTTVDNDGTLVVQGGVYGTTSTDQCYKRLSAIWDAAGPNNTQVLNVRWFGAHVGGRSGDAVTPCERAYAALGPRGGGGDFTKGALYFPSGEYGFKRMLELVGDSTTAFEFYGDGGSSEMSFNFTSPLNLTTNFAMIHFMNQGPGSSFHSFSVQNHSTAFQTYPASIIRASGGVSWRLSDITAYTIGHFGTANAVHGETYRPNTPREIAPGGIFFVASGTQCVVERLETIGCWGTQLQMGFSSSFADGDFGWPSGSVSNCKFQQALVMIPGAFDCPFWASGTWTVGTYAATVTSTNPLVTREWLCISTVTSATAPASDPTHWLELTPGGSVIGTRPTVWFEHGDSLVVDGVFTENGGPARAFPGSTITGGGSFVIDTITNHYLGAGDWIVINGATDPAYNHKWRIASVTAHTITIATNIASTETNCYVTTLFVAVLYGGGNPSSTQNGGIAESKFSNIFSNTGGVLIEGTVAHYLCARTGPGRGPNDVGGLQFGGLFSDYGETTLFIHGTPTGGEGAEGFNKSYGVQVNNIQPNGGPRGDFGWVRIETAQVVSINGPMARAATTAYSTYPRIIPAPPAGIWAFTPIPAVVVSDGGTPNAAAYGCDEITISGGTLQDVFSSQFVIGSSGLVSVGLQVEGTKLRNIRCRGAGIDLISTNSTPLRLLNGATRAVAVSGVYQELVNVDFWQGRATQVYQSANQSIPDSVATYLAQFNAQVLNDDGFWDTGAQDRLTIARPVYRVRISANLTFAGPPGANSYAQIVVAGVVVASQGWGASAYLSLCSPIVQVLPGQIVQVLVEQFSGGALNLLGGATLTNLSLEVIA